MLELSLGFDSHVKTKVKFSTREENCPMFSTTINCVGEEKYLATGGPHISSTYVRKEADRI